MAESDLNLSRQNITIIGLFYQNNISSTKMWYQKIEDKIPNWYRILVFQSLTHGRGTTVSVETNLSFVLYYKQPSKLTEPCRASWKGHYRIALANIAFPGQSWNIQESIFNVVVLAYIPLY